MGACHSHPGNHQHVVIGSHTGQDMAEHEQGHNGEHQTPVLGLCEDQHQGKGGYRHDPCIDSDQQSCLRFGYREIGSNPAQQSDRYELRSVENESGQGQPYHGQPSFIRRLHPRMVR